MKTAFVPTIQNNPPSHLPLLFPHFGVITKSSRLYSDVAARTLFESPILNITNEIQQADFILMPYDYFLVADRTQYIGLLINLSRQYNKKIVILDYSDFHTPICVPNAVLFRTSVYKSHLKTNEIVMPPIVHVDTSDELVLRDRGPIPSIGFCGWAQFDSPLQHARAVCKARYWDIRELCGDKKASAKKQGIFFRKQAIAELKHSKKISANFIIRSTYSGHANTISLDSSVARKEFISNLANSDLALCVKGDGNYSMRMYEALSLGRIPLLIDTDVQLPLEDRIMYDEFMIRVPYSRIVETPDIVEHWWSTISESDYEAAQRKAAHTYKSLLRADQFLSHMFDSL